ncbi:MAG: hypothetical protein AAGU75_11935 [Bacillota bacterium]
MSMPQEPIRAQQIDPVLQGIKDRNESYLATIYALHGFILAVKRTAPYPRENIHSSIGRRMHYANGKSKRDFCTPDLVIQLDNTEGIIGEAKLLVCQNNQDNWAKYVKQAKRYDNDLVGWWTKDESINQTNLVWITELTFSSKIGDYFKEKIDTGEIKFNRPFAVIEYSKHPKAREFLFLRTRIGDMPGSISQAFKEGIEIPLETLIFENQEKKFYDAKPSDIEYVMDILWQNFFTKEALTNHDGKSRYDDKEKVWRIPIQLDELTINVQKIYGAVGGVNREVEYPQKAWIKEALDQFVSIGLAVLGLQEDEYIILYKKYSRPMEKFISLIHKKKRNTQSSGKQMALFDIQSVNQ